MEKNQVHWILAIVALVAVVGLMSGFSGCTAQQGGDLAGEASKAVKGVRTIEGGYGDGNIPDAISCCVDAGGNVDGCTKGSCADFNNEGQSNGGCPKGSKCNDLVAA